MGRVRAHFFAIVAVSLGAGSACTLLIDADALSEGAAASDEAGADAKGDERTATLDGSTEASAEAGGDAAAQGPYVTAVLADKPLLYYRFGEAEGTPARDEVSGSGTPYPVQGITLGAAGAIAGDTNTAITLDGTGKIALTQNVSFAGMQPFSVEAWVSRSSATAPTAFLVDNQAWAGGRRGWSLRASLGSFAFERALTVDGSTTYNTAATDEPLVAGEWHHIVGTYDGTTQRIYVDTVRGSTFPGFISLPDIGIPLAVGKQNCDPCTSTGFAGTLDELAIYPQALSEGRILAHYKAGKGL